MNPLQSVSKWIIAVCCAIVFVTFGSVACGQPLGTSISGGAYPGAEWNYSLSSATDSVAHAYNSANAGYTAGAYGGPSPSVSATAWAIAPDGYQAFASAFGNGQVVWQYRIVPGDASWANQTVPVTMSFSGRLFASGYEGSGSARIWSGAQPIANADGWGVASGGGWGISWSLGHGGDLTFGGDPTFAAPYNYWVGMLISASTGIGGWTGNSIISSSAFLDPTISIYPSWLAAHPGDRIEFTVATPEPATLSLLALGAMAMLRRRRTA